MQRHHEVEFAQFVEAIYSDAASTVRWDRLYRWFGADRITKSVWRDIYLKWSDLCEFHGYEEVPQLTCIKLPNSLTIMRKNFSDEEATHLSDQGELIIEKSE
jgi:hypothetical protein